VSGLALFFLLPLAPSSGRFLEDEVHFLISSRERAELVELTREEERERFIELFWARRDPSPGTLGNEAREAHERRLSESDLLFSTGALRGRHTERGRIHQLLGPPRFRESFDRSPLVPLELWHYTGVVSPFLPESFYLVFFRPPGDSGYHLYRPAIDGIGALLQDGQPARHLLEPGVSEIARVDRELAAAIESLAPGGESAAVQWLASLDALPDLLDRNRRETASVRSEASFRKMPAQLEAVLLYDDAEVPEIHYALELAPEVTKSLLASPRQRFTLQGTVLGDAGELDRWEDMLALEVEPGTLSFQGRRLASPRAGRIEVALVDERGETAFASADVRRLFLAHGARELGGVDPGLPFRVGDRLLSPVAGAVVSSPGAFAVAQLETVESEIVWEIWKDEARLWHARGPSADSRVAKDLPLPSLEDGSYRLVLRTSTTVFERGFEWRPDSGQIPRTRVIARERPPREEVAYRRARASSFSRRGDRARAIEELAVAARVVPDDVRLQLELASFRYAVRRYEEVVEQLYAARVAFPEEIDVLVLLAASLESLGRIEEAAVIYEEALMLSPENEELKVFRDRVRAMLSHLELRRDR